MPTKICQLKLTTICSQKVMDTGSAMRSVGCGGWGASTEGLVVLYIWAGHFGQIAIPIEKSYTSGIRAIPRFPLCDRMSGAKLDHAVAEQNPTLQFYEKQGIRNPPRCQLQLTQKSKKGHHHNIPVPNCTDNACTLQLTHIPTKWCHYGQCRSARQSRLLYPGYTVATPICSKTSRSLWHEPYPDPNVWTQPPITSDSLTLLQRKAQPANFKQHRDPKRMSVWMATHTEHTKKRPSSQHLGAKLDPQCLHTPTNPHTQKVASLRAMPICEAISTPLTLDTLQRH